MLDKAIACGRSWRAICNKAFLNARTGSVSPGAGAYFPDSVITQEITQMAEHGALATLKDLAEKEVGMPRACWVKCVADVSRRKNSQNADRLSE